MVKKRNRYYGMYISEEDKQDSYIIQKCGVYGTDGTEIWNRRCISAKKLRNIVRSCTIEKQYLQNEIELS